MLPGGISEFDPTQTDKTTIAPDASEAPCCPCCHPCWRRGVLAATFCQPVNHFVPQEELINPATPAVQRSLIASGYCRVAPHSWISSRRFRFNPAANVAVSVRSLKAQEAPEMDGIEFAVMLLLGNAVSMYLVAGPWPVLTCCPLRAANGCRAWGISCGARQPTGDDTRRRFAFCRWQTCGNG